jgi:hypothetical protein
MIIVEFVSSRALQNPRFTRGVFLDRKGAFTPLRSGTPHIDCVARFVSRLQHREVYAHSKMLCYVNEFSVQLRLIRFQVLTRAKRK